MNKEDHIVSSDFWQVRQMLFPNEQLDPLVPSLHQKLLFDDDVFLLRRDQRRRARGDHSDRRPPGYADPRPVTHPLLLSHGVMPGDEACPDHRDISIWARKA